MQTETIDTIFQKVPMLSEEQQQRILEMTESYLSQGPVSEASARLRDIDEDGDEVNSLLRGFNE
jgi:hypothetical protein